LTERPVAAIAREALALTKLNWNQTPADGQLPITCAPRTRVGEVLGYVAALDVLVAPRYAFYT
jgi:hypothetical protein